MGAETQGSRTFLAESDITPVAGRRRCIDLATKGGESALSSKFQARAVSSHFAQRVRNKAPSGNKRIARNERIDLAALARSATGAGAMKPEVTCAKRQRGECTSHKDGSESQPCAPLYASRDATSYPDVVAELSSAGRICHMVALHTKHMRPSSTRCALARCPRAHGAGVRRGL